MYIVSDNTIVYHTYLCNRELTYQRVVGSKLNLQEIPPLFTTPELILAILVAHLKIQRLYSPTRTHAITFIPTQAPTRCV